MFWVVNNVGFVPGALYATLDHARAFIDLIAVVKNGNGNSQHWIEEHDVSKTRGVIDTECKDKTLVQTFS